MTYRNRCMGRRRRQWAARAYQPNPFLNGLVRNLLYASIYRRAREVFAAFAYPSNEEWEPMRVVLRAYDARASRRQPR